MAMGSNNDFRAPFYRVEILAEVALQFSHADTFHDRIVVISKAQVKGVVFVFNQGRLFPER